MSTAKGGATMSDTRPLKVHCSKMDLLIRHSMYAVNVMSFNRSCPSTSVYLAYHRPKKVPMKGSFPSCFLVVAV